MSMPSDEEVMLMPPQKAVARVLSEKGIPAPRITSHFFKPGDASYGWARQCSVTVPVVEAGQVVGAHCGGHPEDHIREA